MTKFNRIAPLKPKIPKNLSQPKICLAAYPCN